jgi:hypothetical protein
VTTTTIFGGISGSYDAECENVCLWVIAPCTVVESDQRFRGAYCLHHQGDDEQKQTLFLTMILMIDEGVMTAR